MTKPILWTTESILEIQAAHFLLMMILKQVSYHNALYTLDLSGTGIEHKVAQIGQWDMGPSDGTVYSHGQSHPSHGTVG